MNAVVARLLTLPAQQFIHRPSAAVRADLTVLADNYRSVGPIPSALLLSKLATDSVALKPVPPEHEKLFNAVSVTVCETAAQLPSNLAIQTFSSLCRIGHPTARTILSSIQDKWFENWNPASVAKGSRRPKLKQAVNGVYGEGSTPRINNLSLLRTLFHQQCFNFCLRQRNPPYRTA